MAISSRDHAKFLEEDRWKSAIQSYLATVAYLDMNLGRLLDGFDNSPIRDNTIIVFWGDHGWHFGEKDHWRKFALWEEATRAPLIWIAPGVTQPRGQCDRDIDFMTIYPTLCVLAGLKTPEHAQGKSIRTLLEDPVSRWDQPAIMTHGFRNHAVRNDRWRLIQYKDGSQELYDRQTDLHEWTNLATDFAHQSIIQDLQSWLPTKNAQPTAAARNRGKRAKRNDDNNQPADEDE